MEQSVAQTNKTNRSQHHATFVEQQMKDGSLSGLVTGVTRPVIPFVQTL